MPILKAITAPNGAPVSLHKVRHIELGGDMQTFLVTVSSWSNQASHDAANNPLWNWQITVPEGMASGAAGLAQQIEEAILVDGPFAGGARIELGQTSLDAAKARKRAQINAWRLQANRSSFQYAGHPISCDELSRGDLDGVANTIALTGDFPADFPHAWKTVDNAFVPVPDVATFAQLYAAMTAQGSANFARSQALKALLASYTDEAQVAGLNWETPTA